MLPFPFIESAFARDVLRIGVSGHLYIQSDSQRALREFYRYHSTYIEGVGEVLKLAGEL